MVAASSFELCTWIVKAISRGKATSSVTVFEKIAAYWLTSVNTLLYRRNRQTKKGQREALVLIRDDEVGEKKNSRLMES
jgi:hypothetical protein